MLAVSAQPEISRAALVVETITEISAFENLKGEWQALVDSRASTSIFLTWEWLFTWWRHLSDGRHLSILAIRDRSELIALAPLCVARPDWLRARPFSSIQFLATGSVGSDYLDVLVRPGYEEAAEEILTNHLATLGRPLHLTQLKRGTSFAARVAHRLDAGGWRVQEAETNVCPFISLAGHTWESYLATLGSEHRYNFRRKWRRLQQDHEVRFEQASTPAQSREAIELVIKLHNQRWRERGGSNAFHTPSLVDFHREWSVIALERGWLRLYVLRLNDVPVASLYGFLYRGTFYFYQAGFDPDYAKYSVGLVMMGLAIRRAIEEGAAEYDLLHGSEEYKSHWSRQARNLGRLEIDPPGIQGWISQSVLEFGRTAKQIVRRNQPA